MRIKSDDMSRRYDLGVLYRVCMRQLSQVENTYLIIRHYVEGPSV
jgi:hypothetical protein